VTVNYLLFFIIFYFLFFIFYLVLLFLMELKTHRYETNK